MKITAEPKSDQLNAEDLVGGPRTVTVAGVREGTAEQKYDVQLEGESRVWRPPLTVLRTLIKCWGDDASQWAGKRATLYCDETVTFGREAVGGIRVSHVSGIEKALTVSVTATRGKRTKITVQPLAEEAPVPTEPMITPEVWSRIQEAAQMEPEQLAAWVSEQLGRALSGPQEITEEEGGRLLAALQGEEGA